MNIAFQHIARSQRFRASIGGTDYIGLKIRPIPGFCPKAGRRIDFNAILYPLHKELVGNEGVIASVPELAMVEKAA